MRAWRLASLVARARDSQAAALDHILYKLWNRALETSLVLVPLFEGRYRCIKRINLTDSPDERTGTRRGLAGCLMTLSRFMNVTIGFDTASRWSKPPARHS